MGLIMHKGIAYGGGSDVEANPSGTATANLSKIGIDSTVYDIIDTDAIHTADVGVADGVASLDSNGKVQIGQLPSYVDDVINGYFANSKFYSDPTVGGYYYGGSFYYDADHENLIPAETGRFYYNYSSSAFYVYNGSAYVTTSDTPDEITGEDGKIYVDLNTNKTYRWSGVAFVEISPSLSLGITANTAYYGDKGKTAYDHATDSDKVGQTATGFYKVGATSDGHIAALTAVQKSDITALGIPDSSDIPTVNDSTITIQKNGTDVDTFTTNQSSAKTINITMGKSDVGLSNVPNVSTNNQTPTFTEASARANIASGEKLSVILGKVKKFFSDLKTVAFTGSYSDLTDKPTIPAAQIQSDWTQTTTTAADYIKNKPTIPAAQIQSDWNQTTTTAKDYIKNKPTLGTASKKDVPSSGDASSSQVVMGNDTRLTDARNAADVSAWAKAADKPTYTASEVGLGNVPNVSTNNQTPTFTQASTRANIASGEKLSVILGKIMKFFADLKTVAFTGSYNDLTDTPTITSGTVTSVKITGTSPIVSSSSAAITTSGTRTISHADSGATAGSYGDSSAQTPTYGDTFKVPYVTVNATGHVTEISEHTVAIPVSDNTDEKITSQAQNPSSDTSYSVLFSGTSNQKPYRNDGITYRTKEGTTSASGVAKLILGNSKTSTTDKNKRGTVLLYGDTGKYVNIVPGSNSSDITLTLPTSTGTVALTSSDITGNADTATTAAKLSNTSKIGDTNKPVYFTANGVPSAISYTIGKSVPSDAVFTDTKNTAGSTNTSSKIFLIGATSQGANPQTYSQDTAYVGTDGCLYSGGTKVLTSHQDISGKLDKSGGTMTGRLTMGGEPISQVITGTGTVGQDKGSGQANRYVPSEWVFNTGVTVTDGDIFTIKIPVDGISYGVWVSMDNGTTYYPVAINGTTRLGTHYGANSYLTLQYENAGTVTVYNRGGSDATSTKTKIFRVLNFYNSDTNTILRVYRQNTGYNNDYPLLASRTLASSIGTAGTNASYSGVYGVMWDDTTKVPTLNPSTGEIKAKIITVSATDDSGGIQLSTPNNRTVTLRLSNITSNKIALLPNENGTLATREWVITNEPTTGTITKHSGITSTCTLDRMTCSKKNGWVVASCRLHTINPKVTATGNFFVIPTGFRPSTDINCIGYMHIYYETTDMGFRPVPCVVYSNGYVEIAYGSAYTTDQVYFYAMYPLS